jgi:hypothetical protein
MMFEAGWRCKDYYQSAEKIGADKIFTDGETTEPDQDREVKTV